MNEILVSLAPTTTILAFFTILLSESIRLVMKHKANGASFSSNGSLLYPSTLFFASSSFLDFTSSDSNLSWSHFRSRKCGNRLLLTWTSQWKMGGMIVSVLTSKQRQFFWVNRITSFSMNLVCFSKIGLTQVWISLVWPFLSASASKT